jgi:hypothetical protein
LRLAVFFLATPITAKYQESAMMENANGTLSKRLRCAAFALTACGIATAAGAHARPNYSTVLVPPAELPEPARHGGEGLFLRDAIDGRTILYVEQGEGRQLASFDVSDPAHIKSEGPVPFDSSEFLQMRAEITNPETGTTFVIANDGLYVIRRPAVEVVHQLMVISPN